MEGPVWSYSEPSGLCLNSSHTHLHTPLAVLQEEHGQGSVCTCYFCKSLTSLLTFCCRGQIPFINLWVTVPWRHPQQRLTLWKTINTLCKVYLLKTSSAMTDAMETINTLCKAYLLKTSPATKFYMFICCCLGRPVCFMSQNGDCTHPRRQGTLSDENKTKQSNIVTRWLFDVYFSHKLIFSWMHIIIRYVRPLFSTEQHCCHEVKIAHFQQTISVLFCAIC